MTTAYLPGLEHEERLPELSQWYTEPRLARKVWRWANRYEQPRTVLEPACGHGALVKPILEDRFSCTDVVLIDIDPRAVVICEQLCVRARHLGMSWEVACTDFLAHNPERHEHHIFDLALMNPPYDEGKAEEFIMHALAVCPRVVGVFKASVQHGSSRFRMLWSTCRVTREVRLAARPSFGLGENGKQALTDYVVLEIKKLDPEDDVSSERWVLQEHWP